MNKQDILFIKHTFFELCRTWKIVSLLGVSFLLCFWNFWFRSEIATPLIVSLLVFAYLSSPFVHAALLSLANNKNKGYFLLAVILINICALFIFQFSYMIDYHFSSMYAYRPDLLQCFLLYFGGIAFWRHEMTFKEILFSIRLGKIYQIKRWILMSLAAGIVSLFTLFLILTPIQSGGLSDFQERPCSLLLQQLYLYKLKIHFTYNDFKAIYYIGWGARNQQTSAEALELAIQHYQPIQLVRFALFMPGIGSDSLLRQIDYTQLNLKIIQDNACDLDNTSRPTDVAGLIGHKFTCPPDDDKMFLSLPYLLKTNGKPMH